MHYTAAESLARCLKWTVFQTKYTFKTENMCVHVWKCVCALRIWVHLFMCVSVCVLACVCVTLLLISKCISILSNPRTWDGRSLQNIARRWRWIWIEGFISRACLWILFVEACLSVTARVSQSMTQWLSLIFQGCVVVWELLRLRTVWSLRGHVPSPAV